jgi:hypothetical protein
MPDPKYECDKESSQLNSNNLRSVNIANTIPQLATYNYMLCGRSKNFEVCIETVTDPAAKLFFNQTAEYLSEIEFELDCFKIYLDNLKMDYPDIYRKIKRLDYRVCKTIASDNRKGLIDVGN